MWETPKILNNEIQIWQVNLVNSCSMAQYVLQSKEGTEQSTNLKVVEDILFRPIQV